MQIDMIDIPDWSFLSAEAAKDGYYTDCFATEVDAGLTLEAFINAFYTTWLFRAERLLLRVAARVPSTDEQLRDLAGGQGDGFAAWTVEARGDAQILLNAGRTKSCLMVVPKGQETTLMFGSVVVPEPAKGNKPARLGPVFDTLLGAHKVYSRLLLGAAARKLL